MHKNSQDVATIKITGNMENANRNTPIELDDICSDDVISHSMKIYGCCSDVTDNEFCKRCNPQFKKPLLPWIVGKDYWKTKERIMVIGKPHRGNPGIDAFGGTQCASQQVKEEYWEKRWPYWSYTREILERIYGDSARDSFIFTNIIKCANTTGIDKTTSVIKSNCIDGFQAIWKEISYFKPRNVIIYTGSHYHPSLDNPPFVKELESSSTNHKMNKIQCGQKMIDWWDRECHSNWDEKVRILITSHPERKKKSEYVHLISSWISEKSSDDLEIAYQ